MADSNLLTIFLENDGTAGEAFEAFDALAFMDPQADKLRVVVATGQRMNLQQLTDACFAHGNRFTVTLLVSHYIIWMKFKHHAFVRDNYCANNRIKLSDFSRKISAILQPGEVLHITFENILIMQKPFKGKKELSEDHR